MDPLNSVRLQLVSSRTRKTRHKLNKAPTNLMPVSTARNKMDVTIKHKNSRTRDTVKTMQGSTQVQVTEFSLPEKGEKSAIMGTKRQGSGQRWLTLYDDMSPQTVRLPQST